MELATCETSHGRHAHLKWRPWRLPALSLCYGDLVHVTLIAGQARPILADLRRKAPGDHGFSK